MFDKEELEILQALEEDKLVKSINADEEIALAKQSAKEYLQKTKNITLRLNMMDLKEIKAKSKEMGIPYQNIIQMLIHQFTTNKIKLSM